MFRFSLNNSPLPADWKAACAVSIHKKSDKLILTNYRPVSIASACSKLTEHILAASVRSLSNRNVLCTFLRVFTQRKSTNQLGTTLRDFFTGVRSLRANRCVCINFAKACDEVSHRKPLHKQESIGLPGYIGKSVEAYLRN